MRSVEQIERELRDLAARANALADELREMRLSTKGRTAVRPIGPDEAVPSEAVRALARRALRKRGL